MSYSPTTLDKREIPRKPKKIMFISPGLSVGGAEMMLLKLLSRLDRSRFDAVIVSLTDVGSVGRSIGELGFRVLSLGIRPGRVSLSGLLALREVIKLERPDLLQGWMYHGNFAAYLAGRLLARRAPLVLSIRGTRTVLSREKLNTGATIWWGSRFSGKAHAVINNSRVSAAEHARLLGYSRSNVVVIPNGFDTDVFRPDDEARIRLRVSLGLADEALLVGLVGRVDPVKDHPTFLRAATLVKANFPNAKFVLIGEGADRSNADLLGVIRDCHLEDAVHLLGLRNDVPQLTAALDLCVLSSLSEGFPNVVGEAMSCGVCVVSTAAGDARWIIGNTGAIAPPRRPDMLAKAISRLLFMEPAQRRNLGRLARARVIENFSLSSVVQKYEELYGRLLGLEPREVA